MGFLTHVHRVRSVVGSSVLSLTKSLVQNRGVHDAKSPLHLNEAKQGLHLQPSLHQFTLPTTPSTHPRSTCLKMGQPLVRTIGTSPAWQRPNPIMRVPGAISCPLCPSLSLFATGRPLLPPPGVPKGAPTRGPLLQMSSNPLCFPPKRRSAAAQSRNRTITGLAQCGRVEGQLRCHAHARSLTNWHPPE